MPTIAKNFLFILICMTLSQFLQRNASATTSEIDLQATCGAAGDGITDDSGALKTCINMINAAYATSPATPVYLHVPAGAYLIKNTNGTMPGFSVGAPGAIVGDGPNKSSIWLDSGYSGDLFSWSGASSAVDYPGNTVNPLTNLNTPIVSGITIIGNVSASRQQNALMFYDLDDAVTVQDLEVYSMPGQCISIGHTKNNSIAYVRESFFKNIKCWNSGTTSSPAVEIGSTTSSTSDATNELNFYKLDIFNAAGTGLAISNHNQWNSTRAIKFFGLRIENSAKDAFDIGLSTDSGQVAYVDVYDLDEPSISSGYYGAKITTGSTNQPYGISIRAVNIGPGSGGGIDIDNGRNILIQAAFSTTGPNVTLGSGAGSDISFFSAGGIQPNEWSYSYASLTSYGASLAGERSPALVFGLPTSSGKVGTAAMQVTTSGSSAARLTMDGATSNSQNCFNPQYSQGYNLSIQLIAQDSTTPSKNYSWTMPIAYFNSWYGAGTATLSTGTPTTISNGTLTGTSVSTTADTTNGCLNLSFTPPTGNTDTWNVSALITFARAP